MTKAYPIKNLGCASCAAKMEKKISALPGVASARVNFLTGRLTLDADEKSIEAAAAQASTIIKQIEPGAALVLPK
jgi:Cd2+/Zn2+-exporting ATPase